MSEPIHRAHFGPISGTLLAVGLAAIAGGAVVLILAPFRMYAAADATSARLFLTRDF